MASASQPIRLHSRVAVSRMGLGTVLFVGQTSFAPGLWVGVELDCGVMGGKNDGSVQGKRYFETGPNQGVFVRSSQLEVLDGEDEDQDGYSSQPYGDDPEDAEETLMEQQMPTLVQTAPRRSLQPAMAPSSAARSDSFRARSSQVLPSGPSSSSSTRSDSPKKPLSASRPSLVSRSSVASSVPAPTAASRATVVPSAATARRTATAATAAFSTKAASSMPMKTTTSRIGTVTAPTGYVSTASSTGSAASARRPGSSVSASRTTSPMTPSLGARPAVGRTVAGTAHRLAVSTNRTVTSSRALPSATAPRSTLHSSNINDPRSTAARTALNTTTRARSSMAFTARSLRGADDNGIPHVSHSVQQSARSPDDSPNGGNRSHESATNSPSAAARIRLDASRARLGERRPSAPEVEQVLSIPQPAKLTTSDEEGSAGEECDEDDDDLLNLLTQGQTLQQHSKHRSPGGAPTSLSSAEAKTLKREVEELRVKFRLAEKRRDEERTRVKELERWKEESSEKIRLSEAATVRAQNLSAQLLAAQTAENELILEKEELEHRIDDLTEQLEMAALDREMAEEKAEAALGDLDALKESHEELSLEAEVLREENALHEHGPIDEGERTSAGWIQLEKQNERLKQALIRLRDVTSETDHDQKRRISDLEKELSALAELQDSRDSLASKLQASEAQLEDVKTQLDDALGAEEMLEELTERNLFLGEKMSEMAATVEELEALKELNEELEEVHIETEKQLQEEIDLKDMMLRERNARVETLEANANEYEATFAQFRELVLNLQGDVESLRAERDGLVEEGKNAQLSSQSREMLNLNMKLQSSALKSQARTIDAELARLRTDQAMLQLETIQAYLPVHFSQEGDRDAVAGLLFFERMSTKANLIKSILESNHEVSRVLASLTAKNTEAFTDTDGQDTLGPAVRDTIIVICQLRHSLAHFAAVCNSVSALLRLAPPGTFLKCGRLYKEIQSAIEPRVDAFVEALRKEELKEADCSTEFKRFVRQFEEMSYALMVAQEEEIQQLHEQQSATPAQIPSGEGDLAAKEVGSATLLDIDLDTLCAALTSARQVVGSLCSDPIQESVEWQLDGQTLEERFFDPLHRLVNDIKATKLLARKLLRRLSNLASNDEAVSMDAIGGLPSLGRLSSKLVAFAMTLQSNMSLYVDEVRSSQAPFALHSMLSVIKEAGRDLRMDDGSSAYEGETGPLASANVDAWKEALDATSYLAKTINELVSGATEQDKVIKIGGIAPWEPRAAAVHALSSRNVEAEAQMLKLQDDLRDLYQQIKARDAALSEGAIKMERLQRQLERTKGRDDAYEEAKARLFEAKQETKAYQEANEALQTELDNLEKANESLRIKISSESSRSRDGKGKTTGGDALERGDAETEAGAGASAGMAVLGSSVPLPFAHLETDYLMGQLEAMRSALRYLREENALLKGSDLRRELEDMPELGARCSLHRRVPSSALAIVAETAELPGIPCKPRPTRPADEDLRSAEDERKQLYSSLLRFAATTKVVKLSPVATKKLATGEDDTVKDSQTTGSLMPTGGDGRQVQTAKSGVRRVWQPLSALPSFQYEAQREAADKLALRYAKFRERSQQRGYGSLLLSRAVPLGSVASVASVTV